MRMDELTERARQAREQAYVPYSHFAVGAAVLTDDGHIYTGCNIENSSYGMSLCAERVAMFKAVSAGYRHLKAIAVVGDTKGPVSPCGACRQVMTEFMPADASVTLSNLHGKSETLPLKEVLPFAFFLNDDRVDE
ncbi:cytidine deaminase [Lapidilactobacillus wuchangensis]|uniref:cytidine deaminase n=1 Tax=Lapidilactobacillus wuchangensis TaxID=2486001 RepID=UPI00385108BE